MSYEIQSHIGVGALRFGMTSPQVRQILGNPRFSRRDANRLREMHGLGGPALTFKAVAGSDEPGLAEIGFARTAGELVYRGTNLFVGKRSAIVNMLYGEDPDPKEVSGTLIFQRLGITLTGFHSGPEESAAVTAFAPGVWDAQLTGAASFRPG